MSEKVITRVFINSDGNIVVTDLWNEVRELLGPHFSMEDGAEGELPPQKGASS